MKTELTVGDLRKALEGVPDYLRVSLGSDTGVDQGLGTIVVESARRVRYNTRSGAVVDYFEIYANDLDPEEDDE